MKLFGVLAAIFVGYFLLRFGMVSRGRLRRYIEILGGLILTTCFISAFFMVGWARALLSVLVFWFVVTPIVEVLIRPIENRINAPYKEVHEHMAKKYGTTPEAIRKRIYENLDKG